MPSHLVLSHGPQLLQTTFILAAYRMANTLRGTKGHPIELAMYAFHYSSVCVERGNAINFLIVAS